MFVHSHSHFKKNEFNLAQGTVKQTWVKNLKSVQIPHPCLIELVC